MVCPLSLTQPRTSTPRVSTRMLAPMASLVSTLSVVFSSQLRYVKAAGLEVRAAAVGEKPGHGLG